MSHKNTFSIIPIRNFVYRHTQGATVIVDPFANSCKIGTIRNDLNPEFQTDYCMDAKEFLSQLPDESADVVLFDPPYSQRQVKEVYNGIGLECSMEDTQMSFWSDCKDRIKNIVKPGGVVLCFGWNTNGVGINRGFEMFEILLVAHGANKNDTICTAERKINQINIFQ